MTLVRGALISIILSKTLTVSAIVAATKGSGTLTLMSTDVENVGRSLTRTISGSGSLIFV